MGSDATRKRELRRKRSERGVERPRCAAKNRSSGRQCRNYALEGRSYCKKHGGHPPDLNAGELPKNTSTGSHSLYLQALSQEGRTRLAQLESDPDLFDLKRPAALSSLIIERMLVEPTPEAIRETAKQMMGSPADGGREPTDLELVMAQNKLLQDQHKMIARHAKILIDAQRQVKLGELLVQGAAPFLSDLADTFERLSAQYIGDPDKHRQFVEAIHTHLLAVMGQIARAAK